MRQSNDGAPKEKPQLVESASPIPNAPSVVNPTSSNAATINAQRIRATKALTTTSNATKARTQVPSRPTPKDREKVLDHLRQHSKNRPVKQITLERHLTSVLGGKVAPKVVQGLIAELRQEGVIKFEGNKVVEYKIPKRKK
jgi:hypothetical protein